MFRMPLNIPYKNLPHLTILGYAINPAIMYNI